MTFSELEQLFKARRSIRKWQDKPVPEELIIKAVEAAALSPNSGGKQPYQCYVITDPAKIAAIGDAVQEVSDYLASLPAGEMDQKTVARWQQNSAFFRHAPVLIAISATIYQSVADKLQAVNMEEVRVAEINRWRQIAASRIQTVGAFVDHLLLALHTLGLAACWMGGPAQAKRAIEQILNMGADEDFVALIPVGYAAEEPAPPARKKLDEFVTFVK